jgi:hypothetical protein
MGGSSSKVAVPEAAPEFDLSKVATVPYDVAQQMGEQAQEVANQASAAASELQRQNSSLSTTLFWVLIVVGVGILGFVLYWYAWPKIRDAIWPPAGPSTVVKSAAPEKSEKSEKSEKPVHKWHGSGIKDGQIPSTIATSAKTNAYGYQFWMYVNDWNYKFGQDKHVFSRGGNPLVMLHPTDNVLKISVSVYPNEKTSKNDPAPANNTSSTDDVYLCEVPNVPIQQWVAVAMTVDTKTLDVYFNGQLVKSCLLTGVPKPVSGDVVINDQGGYAGWICSFNSYGHVLQPADAQTFYGFGVPCTIPGESTSYTTTFGVFDTSGKQVSKYVF